MPVDLERAMIVIEAHVEERLAVVGPNRSAIGIGNDVGQVLAGLQVADTDLVIF